MIYLFDYKTKAGSKNGAVRHEDAIIRFSSPLSSSNFSSLSAFLARHAKLGQHAASRFRVHECDIQAFGAAARGLVDQSDSFGLGLIQAGLHIRRGKGDVMDALAPLLDELGDSAVFARRLQQLDFCLPDLEESRLYFLVGDFLDVVALQPQYLFVIRKACVNALDGNSQMFNVCKFHCV